MAAQAVRPAVLVILDGHAEYPCAPTAVATPEFIVVLAKLFAGTIVHRVADVVDEYVPDKHKLAALVPLEPEE